ncbi:cation:proton antiporter [Desulfohalovibrio reitneri]|uniref:cation:proton antiporter n=1 Tax=Desulfohalovibrio reitneri TaxID=1307759 RepID=UPI0004A6E8DE|nr:cation:proton antiporter [Desulfohalovibrio reitneri]
MESQTAITLLTLGLLFLAGLLTGFLSGRVKLPAVTILILLGVLAGPYALNLLPSRIDDWYPLVSRTALLMVAFLLGRKFSLGNIRQRGARVLTISVAKVLGVAVFVFCGLYFLTPAPLALCLLMAGIGPASAPAAISNVVREARAEGEFTETLLGIVAIDDAWGIALFSIMLALSETVAGNGGALHALATGGWELGGAVLLGLALGLPATWITSRINQGDPMKADALGFILVCGGLALWLGFSFLLAAMVLGAVIVNLSTHHDAPFETIEDLEWPIMILFFILAGATLHVEKLTELGLVGGVYVLMRLAGLVLGAYVGGGLAGADRNVRRYLGLAALPQAGVALGLALVAGHAVPGLEQTIIPLVIGSTVVFELTGPVLTRLALAKAGEIGRRPENSGRAAD